MFIADIASRNVRAIFDTFPGAIHAPSIVATEVTSAWLAFVPGALSWDEYEDYLAQFRQSTVGSTPQVQLWSIDELTEQTLGVIRSAAELNATSQVPRIHAHDAYYLALALWLGDQGGRPILVTNDRQPWVVARALGIEVFHGNTCDLGIGTLNVGLVGAHFPENAACQPCALPHCPSQFAIDLASLPAGLGSGTPRTRKEIEAADG